MLNTVEKITAYIKELYPGKDFIPLHEPVFNGREKEYLLDCVDSTFVSSVGKYVDRFEAQVAEYVDSSYAIAVVNGTVALSIALEICGVKPGDEVLTQPLTFVATSNAISHCGARPVFVDVDKINMGLSAIKLKDFLSSHTRMGEDGYCYNKETGNRIMACVPMHTFGHAVDIDDILFVCSKHNIVVVEDSAESLGSKFKNKFTGTYGKLGIFSFNGNKTITTGGGGIIVTDDENLAFLAKHLTTTAKVPHRYEFIHDKIGYNYRMPNVNAALGCAQLETLSEIIENKKETAEQYKVFFDNLGIGFFFDDDKRESNYWLNAIILKNEKEKESFLNYSNENGVMTRPVWRLTNQLNMYKTCFCGDLTNAKWLADRVVNIPSGYRSID